MSATNSSKGSRPSENGRPPSSASSRPPTRSTSTTLATPAGLSQPSKTRAASGASSKSSTTTAGKSRYGSAGASSSSPKTIPHYQARQREDGWFFTTPTGEVDKLPTRFDCLRIAANTERQDRQTAATSIDKSPLTKALRAHFFPNGLPVPAATPLDLQPHLEG